MKAVLKGVALLLLIACAVWLAVLWHWQRTLRDVSTADVVYWLVVLPLLLFTVVLLLRWAWRSVVLPARAASAAAAEAAAAAPAASTGGGAGAPESKRTGTSAVLLGTAVHLPGADTPAALDAALRDQTVQPGPDAELTDGDGLPVHTARLPELDLDALADDAEVLAAQPRMLRALAALAPVVDDIALALPPALPAPSGSTSRPATLRVLLHLPDDTPPNDRELAQAWLARRLAVSAPEWAQTLQLRVLSGPVLALWQQVEQVLAALVQEATPDVLLVAATHSELDVDVVSRWADQRLLFHAQRQPRGRMPGEGAAALLLAPPGTVTFADAKAHLHRAAWAQRSQPVESPGRVSSQTLETVMGSLLEAAGMAPERLPALACDVDRHGARNGELFGAVIARLPHLDAMQDVRALGAVCGHQGAAGLLASVALAAHVVSEPPAGEPADAPPASPCLVLNLDDPSWRLGLLVSAPPAPHPVT